MAKRSCSQLFLLSTVFLNFNSVLSFSTVQEDTPFYYQVSQDNVTREYVKYFARPTVSSPLKKFLDKPTTLVALAKAAELAVDSYGKKSKRTCRLRGILDLKELRNRLLVSHFGAGGGHIPHGSILWGNNPSAARQSQYIRLQQVQIQWIQEHRTTRKLWLWPTEQTCTLLQMWLRRQVRKGHRSYLSLARICSKNTTRDSNRRTIWPDTNGVRTQCL